MSKKKSDRCEKVEGIARIKTGKVVCLFCKTLLTKGDGGQFNRHLEICKRRPEKRTMNSKSSHRNDDEDKKAGGEPPEKMKKIDFFNTKKLKQKELDTIVNAIAKYCVNSGRSYSHCSSKEFKNLVIDCFNAISTGYGKAAKSQLPSRQTVQRRSEAISKRLIEKAHSFLLPYIKKGRAHLLADHGKHIVHYLSIYASVIDDNFVLQIVPLAFVPALDGKSGVETAKLITTTLQKFGWSQDDIKMCSVTADGALGSLSSYFSSYVRCVSHSLNLLGSNGVEPAQFQRKNLTDEEMKMLNRAQSILQAAETLSNSIRNNAEICSSLPRLPALPGETRWLSGLRCLKDIQELEEDLEKVDQKLNVSGSKAFLKVVREDRKIGRAIMHVYGELLSHSVVFQSQTAVTGHLVLPFYKLLEKKWELLINGDFSDVDKDLIDIQYLPPLAKSGLLAHVKYYGELGNKSPHSFAATLLCPIQKDMELFTQPEIAATKQYVCDLLPKTKKPTTSLPVRNSNPVSILSRLVAQKSSATPSIGNDELDRYLKEKYDENSDESVEEYWRRKKLDYPDLYEAAARVFSIVPSESVCETCFSVAGFLLDKRRSRLLYTRTEDIVIGSQLAKKFPNWLDDDSDGLS
ncbi:hypothetical protein CAEBREN_07113 [Caenorhabditis brenneri]|uniref:HAT C-terminal dimerisation domain-containing protein n=1 Tax=Caenorhabditis brenneri TaxID=135651 RepID=G0ND96_CAEBE|nr:hypothetical protein CAEBREN_07113 [Caenorhabditis brenneri]